MHLIAFIFVHVLIFINEPREWAYRLMHLFIYEENRWTETVRHFSCSTAHPAVTAEATKNNEIC